jgi:hypothetical protein
VRWFGREWTITAANAHPLLGRFLRLEDEHGAYDLVHENGADGAIEALSPVQAA